ncbi:serine/threonine-protein phosphatase 2A 56 kDa regulatory subunit delta isoform-like [Suricata suricatta]|uniref:serine/threonine-protein phosphatase 2A 56 kDa regulatory subunit delta isoform-like n=1 Tax=Suricata suricatta TaxID=37032 RepID=UPI001155D02A|nr:serine/threonine-protein phosphatase 2A 56 kDa regulatory subunit delta isoform-like [Suricata suricatta]
MRGSNPQTESPKAGKSGKSSKEGQEVIESEQISSRKNNLSAAPSPVSSKIKVPAPQPIVRRDKRQNSSRFSASNNRELQKLPSLKGGSAQMPNEGRCCGCKSRSKSSSLRAADLRATGATGTSQRLTGTSGQNF